MKIPRYWAKASQELSDGRCRRHGFDGIGWSFVSLQAAKEKALENARAIGEMILIGKKPGQYDYTTRPLVEPLLKEIYHEGSVAAAITRNRYGALVLNCNNVLFIDIDFPPPPTVSLWASISNIFKPQANNLQKNRIVQKQEEILNWTQQNRHSLRLYRTKAGFRLLFTDQVYLPDSDKVQRCFAELGADPLYVRLSQSQNCFRARLTSKPWRCGSPRPPFRFPFKSEAEEDAYREWESKYTTKDANFKVCELIKELGPPPTGWIAQIVELHDIATRISSPATLA
jgi:hypothetical protein